MTQRRENAARRMGLPPLIGAGQLVSKVRQWRKVPEFVFQKQKILAVVGYRRDHNALIAAWLGEEREGPSTRLRRLSWSAIPRGAGQ